MILAFLFSLSSLAAAASPSVLNGGIYLEHPGDACGLQIVAVSPVTLNSSTVAIPGRNCGVDPQFLGLKTILQKGEGNSFSTESAQPIEAYAPNCDLATREGNCAADIWVTDPATGKAIGQPGDIVHTRLDMTVVNSNSVVTVLSAFLERADKSMYWYPNEVHRFSLLAAPRPVKHIPRPVGRTHGVAAPVRSPAAPVQGGGEIVIPSYPDRGGHCFPDRNPVCFGGPSVGIQPEPR